MLLKFLCRCIVKFSFKGDFTEAVTKYGACKAVALEPQSFSDTSFVHLYKYVFFIYKNTYYTDELR